MKKLPIYQVDAFAEYPFSGNPAAVVVLEEWLNKEIMQKIAAENNLSETAFIIQVKDQFEIRWFTPAVEVDLCGHATLASAYVVFNFLDWKNDTIVFKSLYRGYLPVERRGDLFILDFPADDFIPVVPPENLLKGIGLKPSECYKGLNDYLFIFSSADEIKTISPDFNILAKTEGRGVIVSAPGENEDFVSRFFAPQCGINEDPVTGSAHTTLIPYWAKRLKKDKLLARQISGRTGVLYCEYCESRVKIGGKAVLFLTGEIIYSDSL